MKALVFLFAYNYSVRKFYNEQVLLSRAEKNNEYMKKECSVYDGSLRSTVFMEHKIGGGTVDSKEKIQGAVGRPQGLGKQWV